MYMYIEKEYCACVAICNIYKIYYLILSFVTNCQDMISAQPNQMFNEYLNHAYKLRQNIDSTTHVNMPQYKLTYFNLTALGEYIRFLFAYGGIEYEDVRINTDDWAPLKNTFLFGQVPVLDVDGKRITQSMAIGRYLAKLVKINGKNDWEDVVIDEVIDHVNDYRAKITASFYEPNADLNKIKMDQIRNEFLPYYLERFERIVGENNGHFALGRLTAADLLFAATLDYLKKAVGHDFLIGYPNLQKLVGEVRNIPRIKKWIEIRPETAM